MSYLSLNLHADGCWKCTEWGEAAMGWWCYFSYKIEIIRSCPFCLVAAGGFKCIVLVVPNKSQVCQPGSVVIPVVYKATGLNRWTEPQITVPSVTCLCHQHLISWNLGSLTAFKKMEVSCRLSWRLLSLTPRLSIYISLEKNVWLLPCSENKRF